MIGPMTNDTTFVVMSAAVFEKIEVEQRYHPEVLYTVNYGTVVETWKSDTVSAARPSQIMMLQPNKMSTCAINS